VSHESQYDHEVTKHDPKEGFDATEPDSGRITFFVVASVITLAVVIGALQNYFDSEWNSAYTERVTNSVAPALKDQHALENWRFTHYEYTTDQKKEVRLPLDVARQLVLDDAKAGKTFYPAKPTVPQPENPDQGKEAPKEVAKK
jgi:hypothetical protein